jgi:hypothetical protein
MHEVDGGEVAARIEFDPASHGTPLSFLPPLITSFPFATSSNEKVGAPPLWDTRKSPACALAAKRKRNDL